MTDNSERTSGDRHLATLIEEDGRRWREIIARRESGDDDQAEDAEIAIFDEITAYGIERVEQRVFRISAGVRLVAERRSPEPTPPDWSETAARIEYHPEPVDVRWTPGSGWVHVTELDDVALGMAGIAGLTPEWIEE